MPRRFAPAAASLAAALCLAHAARAASKAQDKPLPPRPTATAPATLPPGGPVPSHDPALGPFKATEVTERAVITSKPAAGFTREALENDTYGRVRLRAALAHTGEVTNISVVKGLPDGLTEKAIAAARLVKFRAARKDGRAVGMWVVLEYSFYVPNGEVERPAVVLEQPPPAYTEEARRAKAEGRVVLDVLLTKEGTASTVAVVESLPHGLTEKASEAAGLIRFRPAEHLGRKASVVARVEYVFRLD